jgi:hypothetical protein
MSSWPKISNFFIGWPMMTRLVSWTLWALLWMAVGAHAAPQEVVPVPDADFLEFLGSWQTGDDRWVDPFRAADLSGAETGNPQKNGRSSEGQVPPRVRQRESREEPDRKESRPVDSLRDMKP